MPRYFFDHHDGKALCDEVGIVFADNDAAIRAGMASLPSIAADSMRAAGRHCHNISIVVRREDGVPIYSAALSYCGTRF